MITISSADFGDIPSVINTEAGDSASPAIPTAGVTLTCTASWFPWYAPSHFAKRFLPEKARAARTAFNVASVPEFTNRTLSSEGTLSHINSPHSTTNGVGAGYETPRSSCSPNASITAGWR